MAQTRDAQVRITSDVIIDALKKLGRQMSLTAVAREAVVEMQAQDVKWGVQHHRDGTGTGYGKDVLRDLIRFGAHDTRSAISAADAARQRTEHYAGMKNVDALEWEQILTEEVFEAFEEDDPAKLRAELIQVAAVALNWVTDIDSREA